jgi:hypothetical protein
VVLVTAAGLAVTGSAVREETTAGGKMLREPVVVKETFPP